MKPTIFDIDNWREILHTLSTNKTRTFMTAFGIFWGTAILTICWGGSHGFQGLMQRQFSSLSANTAGVFAAPTNLPYAGFNKGRTWDLTDADVKQIETTFPEIDHLTTIIQVGATLTHDSYKSDGSLIGTEPDFFSIQKQNLLEGRLLTESDLFRQDNVAVIGSRMAASLFPDGSPLGEFVQADGISYRIVGVVSRPGEAFIGADTEYALIVPSTSLRAAYGLAMPGFLTFTTVAGSKPADILPSIKRILRANHSISPDDEAAVQTYDLSEPFEMIHKVFRGIDMVALFIGFGTLLAGVIGVGNIMWIIVKERSTEFGIRRAIGATPGDLIIQILSESIILTTIAGLTGVTFATLILALLDYNNLDPWLGAPGFVISFNSAITILLLFIVFGTLAGIIPAIKAMRIKPVEAINAK